MKTYDALWTKLAWISSSLFYFSGAEVDPLPYLREPFYFVFTQTSRTVKQNKLLNLMFIMQSLFFSPFFGTLPSWNCCSAQNVYLQHCRHLLARQCKEACILKCNLPNIQSCFKVVFVLNTAIIVFLAAVLGLTNNSVIIT